MGNQIERAPRKNRPLVWRDRKMPKIATKSAKEAKIAAPFSAGDFVVYPAHGVGKVTSIESQ